MIIKVSLITSPKGYIVTNCNQSVTYGTCSDCQIVSCPLHKPKD